MGKVRNLKFILLDNLDGRVRLRYRFEYRGEPYGSDVLLDDVFHLSPQKLIEAVNLQIEEIVKCVNKLEHYEGASNG